MHGFCTVFARFQGMQWVLWLAKYDKGCRNCRAENHDALHKNDANSKLLKSECSARWALLIRGPGIRVPSSAPKSHEESQDSSWDFLFVRRLHGLCTVLHGPHFFVSDGVSLWITLQFVLFFAIQVSRARRSCAFTAGSASFRSSNSADTEMAGSASTGAACTSVAPGL